MPSASLTLWRSDRVPKLDEMEAAHAAIGGIRRGRRYTTQQVNHAYVMLLAAQFQAFCRDLHSESVSHVKNAVAPAALQNPIAAEFQRDRKLDRGNPNPGNIGSDFNRIGMDFWAEVRRLDRRFNPRPQPSLALHQTHLETLNSWRNAIAHQDFRSTSLGGRTAVQLAEVRQWRRSCDVFARAFDEAVRVYLQGVSGTSPW